MPSDSSDPTNHSSAAIPVAIAGRTVTTSRSIDSEHHRAKIQAEKERIRAKKLLGLGLDRVEWAIDSGMFDNPTIRPINHQSGAKLETQITEDTESFYQRISNFWRKRRG
jgi:hypothetical protein